MEHGPEQKRRMCANEATRLLAMQSHLTLTTPPAENPSVLVMRWRSARLGVTSKTKRCPHSTATPKQATPAPSDQLGLTEVSSVGSDKNHHGPCQSISYSRDIPVLATTLRRMT